MNARGPRLRRSSTLFPVYLGCLSLVLFRIRSFNEAAEAELDVSSIHKVLAIIMIFAFAGAVLLSRGFPRKWPASLIFFAAYLLVGVSTLYRSEYLVYSVWKLTELGAVMLVGLYVLRESRRNPTIAVRAYRAWLAYLAVLLLSAVVSALIMPDEALRFPVSEETAEAFGNPLLPIQLWGILIQVNPNSLGAASAILLFVGLMTWLEEPRKRTLGRGAWVVLVAAVLVLAQSRTAWLGLALALVFGVAGSAALRRGTKLAAIAVLAVGLVAGGPVIEAYVTRGASADHLAKLSGRTEWWALAINEVVNSDTLGKLFGLGFMSANRDLLANHLGTEAATLHSDYVDALVSTGIVGLTVLVCAVVTFGWGVVALYRCRVRSPLRTQFTGIGCILVVRSLTGTTFAVHNHFILGYVLIAVGCAALLHAHTQQGAMAALPTASGERS